MCFDEVGSCFTVVVNFDISQPLKILQTGDYTYIILHAATTILLNINSLQYRENWNLKLYTLHNTSVRLP